VSGSNVFSGTAQVGSGTSQVTVQATDSSGNVRTNVYELTQTGGSKSFTYDANGSLIADGTHTYEWDAANRLIAVRQGGNTLASFTYDGSGRRASKTAGGVTTSYIYEGAQYLEERPSAGATKRHVYGPGIDEALAQTVGGVISYLTADHLGSVVRTTDAVGTPTLLREYDPWGNLLQGSIVGGAAFTGREWDPETGLYYYRARYYESRTGRFLSEDPIGYAGGMNLFAYVANRPLAAIDPFGEVAIPAPPGQDVRTRGPKKVPDTIACKIWRCPTEESEKDRKSRQALGDALCQEFAFGTKCAYSISTSGAPQLTSPPAIVGGFPVDTPARLRELAKFERGFREQCEASAPKGMVRTGTCHPFNGIYMCACCEKCTGR
jgi:RHS repeat-associated protein